MHSCMHACMHAGRQACMHACMHGCMHACVVCLQFTVFSWAFVRLPRSSLDSRCQIQILVSTCSARFSISSFRFLVSSRALLRLPGSSPDPCFHIPSFWFSGGLSCGCTAPIWIPVSCFPLSDSGLDLLRSLLNFRFPVSGRALVRSPSSSRDSGFGSPISDPGWDRLRSLLDVQLLVSGPDSVFLFQILVLARSARFSIFGVRFLAGPPCDCPAPAWILVSCIVFSSEHFGLDLLRSLRSFRFLARPSCGCLAPTRILVSVS